MLQISSLLKQEIAEVPLRRGEIGIDPATVESAVRELRIRRQALIHDVVLSDADLIALGLG